MDSIFNIDIPVWRKAGGGAGFWVRKPYQRVKRHVDSSTQKVCTILDVLSVPSVHADCACDLK